MKNRITIYIGTDMYGDSVFAIVLFTGIDRTYVLRYNGDMTLVNRIEDRGTKSGGKGRIRGRRKKGDRP